MYKLQFQEKNCVSWLRMHHFVKTKTYVSVTRASPLKNITRKYEKVLFQETQKYILFNQKENANNCLSDLCNNFSLSSQKKDANNHLFDLCDTFSLSSLMSEITGAKPPKWTSIEAVLTNICIIFHQASCSN